MKRKATLALCALAILTLVGCTANQNAQKIDSYIPTIQAAVMVAHDTVSGLAGVIPNEAPKIDKVLLAVNTGLGTVKASLDSYLAAPTSGKLASVISAVDALAQNIDALLPTVFQIKDPGTQQKVSLVVHVVEAGLHGMVFALQVQAGHTPKIAAHVDREAVTEQLRVMLAD